MPYTIDQEALDSPNLKILDINKPPSKSIPFQAFPQMVYLHPKDKAKEHMTKLVGGADELEAAKKQGYRSEPHVPVPPAEDLSKDFDLGQFEQVPSNGLEAKTKADLLAIAKERGLPVNQQDNKETILAAINAASLVPAA